MCKTKWNDGIVTFNEICDKRGCLIPLEFNDLPFIPKRLFYISNVNNGTCRGGHAHKKCKQVFICLNGYIVLHQLKTNKYITYDMYYGNAIYIPEMVWSGQEFYDNGIALVLASEEYDESDYIRDYEEFRKLV